MKSKYLIRIIGEDYLICNSPDGFIALSPWGNQGLFTRKQALESIKYYQKEIPGIKLKLFNVERGKLK